MKKFVTILMSLILSILTLSGCSNKESSVENTENITVKVGAPDGLPAITISKLAKENNTIKQGYEVDYILEATSDALSTDVMKEELDIAIVPSNMAAIAYNKTSNYQILGTVGVGSFYLVSSDDTIKGFDSSLVGKEVGNIGKGLTPDITVQSMIKESSIDPSQIKFNYSNEASDLVSLLATNKITTGIVPEPALSGLISKNDKLKIVASTNETWKELYKNENGYPQSTLIVKKSFATDNKQFIEEFVKVLDENIQYINSDPEKAGEIAKEFGVNIEPSLLKKSIERTNLDFVDIKESKKDYENYYNILFSYNPKILGGSIPNSEIYYK